MKQMKQKPNARTGAAIIIIALLVLTVALYD